MRRLLIPGCLLSVLLLFSCAEKTEQPTMPDEKISRVMADLFTAEAATNGLSGAAKDSMNQVYFDQVLKMHNTTKEEYEKNLRLITNDLPRMEAVINAAEAILDPTKKKAEVEAEKKK